MFCYRFFVKEGYKVKLPGRCAQRTINRLQLTIPIHLNYNGTKALQIIEGKAPYNIDAKNRVTRSLLKKHRPVICKPNPITIALKYQKMYQDATYQTMEKVGEQLGVVPCQGPSDA